MAELLYVANTSLDGLVEDAEGGFDFTEPDEEVHRFINDLVRPVGTFLFGRAMYEVMSYWETAPLGEAWVTDDFAGIWRATDKVVYSRTLAAPTTARTRIEREFDAPAVRALKEAATADLGVGGASLAGQALIAGLVDQIHLFVAPISIGSGKRALPEARLPLVLQDEHRFGSGTVYLHYRLGV